MTVKRVKQPTNIRFDKSTKKQILSLAAQFGVTSSDLIRAAVKEKLPIWAASGEFIVRRVAK